MTRRFRAAAPDWLVLARRRRFGVSGAAAVEFAIIVPVLLMLFWGIIAYGNYFLTAHTIQQLTNDAARAAVAGLDEAERRALAESVLRDGLDELPNMKGKLGHVLVRRDGSVLTLAVRYDASADFEWMQDVPLLELSPNIDSRAAILLGAY
ncbi:MAG: pilus assembly protein [Hyphomonadaceae bacterium]|nr:pilus assembly protein [Hyphomonadaceae bacterium]